MTKEGGDYGGNFAGSERRRKFSGRRNWVVILASRSRKRGEEIKRDPERAEMPGMGTRLLRLTPSSLVRYFFVITISSFNDYR